MSEVRIGELVMSKAGHDRGDLFLVIRREGDYVFLCDGKRRKANALKKKKKKHMVRLGKVCATVAEAPERVNNTFVRKAIRAFVKEGIHYPGEVNENV